MNEPVPTPRPLSLLVAEDNLVNRKVIEKLLARFGHGVMVVDDGAAAVAALEARAFDAVLLDLRMPVMDGLAAARAIRASPDRERASVPLIALTGSVGDEDAEACRAAGFDDMSPKPVEILKLIAMLERLTRTDGPAVLDRAAIDQLLEELGPEDVAELVELFARSSAQVTERLLAAAAAGDAGGVERAAHELKSASAGLGLMRLADLCLQAEMAGRQGRIDAQVIDAFRGARDEGAAALTGLLA
ncbi:MAG: response regulator [Alphaproteobacteria bacterium]|nr:response regulator [Alphaproteobacteria bacterium]